MATKQEVRRETYFSNYKEVAGVRYPHRQVVCVDGCEHIVEAITEVKPLKKIPDDEFKEP